MLSNILLKMFPMDYEQFGSIRKYRIFKIKNIKLELINYGALIQENCPYYFINNGIEFIIKGGYVKRVIKNRNFIDEYVYKIGNIEFILSELVIQKKEIKYNTLTLRLMKLEKEAKYRDYEYIDQC